MAKLLINTPRIVRARRIRFAVLSLTSGPSLMFRAIYVAKRACEVHAPMEDMALRVMGNQVKDLEKLLKDRQEQYDKLDDDNVKEELESIKKQREESEGILQEANNALIS